MNRSRISSLFLSIALLLVSAVAVYAQTARYVAYSTAPNTTAVPTTRTITAGTGLTGGGTLAADRTIAVSFGTASGTVCQGNDARLSDTRTPTSHASTHAAAGSDPVSISVSQIGDATSVGTNVLTASTQASARSAIGAGTSSYADPLTTNGDICYRASGATTRLAVGSAGYVLSVSGALPTYTLPSAAITAASDGAAVLSAIGGVASTRTIAGTALSSDISAATLRSSLSLATIPSTPSTTPIVDLRADVGVTSSSGRVSAWASQGSVGSVSFSQGTAGRQPLLLTNAAPNGGPAIYFDASRTDTLATSYNASLDPASALTIIFVGAVRTTSCVVYERPYAATHTGNFAEWWLYVSNGTVDLRVNSSTNSQNTGDGAGISGWRRPGIHVYRLASGARKYRVNSYDITTAASGATISYTNNIGHRLGTNTSDGEAATMWVYEVLVFSSSLTDAQVLEWDALMSQRWGVPLVFG